MGSTPRVVHGKPYSDEKKKMLDLEDTDIILGVQWLSTLGTISQDYQKMKMEFKIAEGKRVVLRGMTTNAPKDASTQQMEMVLGHGGMHSTIVRESQPLMRRQSYEGISK
jgi:hypothetical protein